MWSGADCRAHSDEPEVQLASYKQARKRQLLLLSQSKKKDRAVRNAIRLLRQQGQFSGSSKAARKLSKYEAQTKRRAAERVQKVQHTCVFVWSCGTDSVVFAA